MPKHVVNAKMLDLMKVLKASGANHCQIAKSLGVNRSTVAWSLSEKRKNPLPISQEDVERIAIQFNATAK